MTNLMDITPKDNEGVKTEETKTATEKPATEGKPPRKPLTARTVEQAPANVKWIKLIKGGTYGYKRAIYEQGKTYEVDLATAEHLLNQFYTIGNVNETIEVYYFEEVKRK